MTLKPDRILFHCHEEPQGYWWDRVRGWEGWEDGDGETKGLVEVLPARDVEWIGKDRHPVKHVSTSTLSLRRSCQFAHKADIIRLEV